MAKRVFTSYEYGKDNDFVNGIRGMLKNDNIDINFYDESVKVPIDSSNAPYIKQVISDMIKKSSIILCIVGEDTHSSLWVEWEIKYARRQDKKIIFMRRKGILKSNLKSNILKPNEAIHDWDIEILKKI